MPLKKFFITLNDVTTTPGLEFGILAQNRDLSYDPRNFEKQKILHPEIEPFLSALEAPELFARAVARAREQKGWEIIYMAADRYRLEVVAVTAILKFRDDVVIEVRPEKIGASVHMRSRSRVGRGDLGANARRVREFFAQLK